MNYLLTIILTVITTLVFNQVSPPKVWDNPRNSFGATNFPTSLDTLTNPSATDSVATVSHSGQHTNANDAIEAIQAKLGTGASTAVANTLFAGNGAGTSLFTTHATATNLTLSGLIDVTGLGTFGSLSSLGNATISGGLTVTGNSTTTNATSSIIAITNYATSTKYFGAGFSQCDGASQGLTWNGGFFGCNTFSTAGIADKSFSSTTSSNYRAKTYSMTNGQTVMWWGVCHYNAAVNNTITFRYRTSNDSASTTIITLGGSPNVTNQNGFGLFTATTTYSVTVDFLASPNNCDEGIGLMTLVFN